MVIRASRALLVSAAFLASGAFSVGCSEPPAAAVPDGGQVNLSDAGIIFAPPDAGEAEGDGGVQIPVDAGPVNTTTIVESVTPPSGSLAGGYRVRIDGEGFTPNSRVFFGDVEGTAVLPASLPRILTVSVPQGAAAGPVTVRVVSELGVGELEGGFTYFSAVELRSIEPRRGTTDGGTPVTITGLGFSPEMVVTVGGREVTGLDVAADGTSATFFAPPGEVGRADVVAIDAFGRAVLELAFTYEAPLRLTSVAPSVVDDVGAVVELRGGGFSDDDEANTAVSVGGEPAARDNLISDARLRVVVPTGLVGAQDVVVTRGDQSATLEDAIVVRPPLTGTFVLTAAVPARVDVAGNVLVTLVGEGLATASAVTIGGTAATNVTVVDDRTLTCTAPPGAEGPATIEVTRTDTSTAQLAQFSYVVGLFVDSVTPNVGPSTGGTAVTIQGRGFVDGAAVSFAGRAAADVVVENATRITATTPAGSAGPADVVVEARGQRAALSGGFRYESPLRVIGVRPARGALGGDTFVTLTGTGFTRGAVSVQFGGTEALPLDVTVVNDSTITLRTPPHQPGLVDVTVIQSGISDTAESVFTYFDPTSIVGGPRGGPIDGAVYITALDAQLGLPIPGLIAYVGTDGSPVASGITNVLGQATVSAPEVVGPQTVTIVGDCYSTATFYDVNATEMTVFLFSLCSPPPSPGEPPPPPPPATIRGRVFGFAKEFFDPAALDQSGCASAAPAPCEIAFAEVRTTTRDEFDGPIPAGGANIVFEEGGEYFIAQSRPGRLAVVALAGIYDLNNDTFRLRQLGIRREVFTQFGVDLEDQDIELTIPLDEEIALSLPDSPLRFEDAQVGFKPTITRVVPFLQFGGEGAFNYTQAVEGRRNHALEEMPAVPGEMLTFIAGAYTTDGRNLLASVGTVTLTAGSRAVAGLGTDSEWGIVQQGQPIVVGNIFVADRPDGSRFASVIIGSPDPSTLQLQDAPDFSATNVSYHIGPAGLPSSEVIQDGVGDLRGGVTIQPVLGLPEIISPVENGVLTDRTLRWKAAPGQQPTIHDISLFDPFNYASYWQIFVDGARTKVVLPRVPELDAIQASLPTSQRLCLEDPAASDVCAFWGALEDFVPPSDMALGGQAWYHQTVFTPGLDFNSWSYLELGTRGRRAWTTDIHVFVKGLD